jgi:hypothetical protein
MTIDQLEESIDHLSCLLDFIDKDFSSTKQKLDHLEAQSKISFRLLWTLYKPGSVAVSVHSTTEDKVGIKVARAVYTKREEVEVFLGTCTRYPADWSSCGAFRSQWHDARMARREDLQESRHADHPVLRRPPQTQPALDLPGHPQATRRADGAGTSLYDLHRRAEVRQLQRRLGPARRTRYYQDPRGRQMRRRHGELPPLEPRQRPLGRRRRVRRVERPGRTAQERRKGRPDGNTRGGPVPDASDHIWLFAGSKGVGRARLRTVQPNRVR